MVTHKTFRRKNSQDGASNDMSIYPFKNPCDYRFAKSGMSKIGFFIDKRCVGKRTTSHRYIKHKIIVDDILPFVSSKNFTKFIAHNKQARKIVCSIRQMNKNFYSKTFGFGRDNIQTAKSVCFDGIAIIHKLINTFDASLLLYGVNDKYDSRFAH